MKLENFLKILKNIKKEHGGDIDVIMADNISVVKPICLDYRGIKKVIITDHK